MDSNLIINAIAAAAKPRKQQDGTDYAAIASAQVRQLAETYNTGGRQIEITALQSNIIPERYARNSATLSIQDQIVLLKSRVAIVGLGGLGGGVVEILARTGVGSLVLIDGDRFEDSNLNRQFLSRMDLLGLPKALAARERVAAVNPSVDISAHKLFIDEDNIASLLSSANLVIDCLDNVTTRFLLENAARKTGIPMVSGAVAGTSGQVTVIFPQDAGLRLVYGNPEEAPPKGAETTLGTLSPAVTVIAAVECSEAVKILLGKKNTLRNRLLLLDLSDNTFETIALI